MVEETPDGILLRQAPSFVPSQPDEVFSSLHYAGTPVSTEDMNAVLLAEARRRNARE